MLDGPGRTFLHVKSTVKTLTCYKHTHHGVLDLVFIQACCAEPKHFGLVTGGLMAGNLDNGPRIAAEDILWCIALHISASVVLGIPSL